MRARIYLKSPVKKEEKAFYGHVGRPGQRGGSLPAGGTYHTEEEIKGWRKEVSSWDGVRKTVAEHAIGEIKKGMPYTMIREGGDLKGISTFDLKWGLRQDMIYVNFLATKEGGYGGKMMGLLARQALTEKKGVSLTSLPKAAGFYEKLGFQKVEGSKLEYYLPPKETRVLAGRYTTKEDRFEKELVTLEPDDGVFCARPEILEEKGGPGSGDFGHAGRPGEVGGSTEGGGEKTRAERARESYKPATREVQQAGIKNQARLAQKIKGEQPGDNKPFDVIVKNHFVEVKTVVRAGNDKITMHPDALQRKLDTVKEEKGKAHTVVFDDRNGKIYYKEGVGSFRLSSMKEVNFKELREVFASKAQKGGPGSGNFEHAGRPGEVGGSAPSGYSIGPTAQSYSKIINKAMGKIEEEGLVLRTHPVEFNAVVGAHAGGSYSREADMKNLDSGKIEHRSAGIAVGVGGELSIYHEYGHHLDNRMAVVAAGGLTNKNWSEDSFAKWTPSRSPEEKREAYADLFRNLVLRGSSGSGFSLGDVKDRGFYSWFDKEVKQFVERENGK